MKGRYAIMVSTEDMCSMEISKTLIGEFSEEHTDVPYEVFRRGEDLLVIDSVAFPYDDELHWEKFFDVEMFLIIYKHSGRGGKSRLTVHPNGNFSKTPLAGNPRKLGYVNPILQTHMFKYLKTESKEPYTAGFEVTHHGPTQLNTANMFIEIGDSEENWKDVNAHKMVHDAIIKFLDTEPEVLPNCIGFGGDHYGERFGRRVDKYAFGHMVAARDLEHLDEELLNQLVDNTKGGVDLVIWDRNKQGKLEEREKVLKFFEDKDIEIVKI